MGWKTKGCVFQRRFQLGILIKKSPMMDEYFVAPRENPQTYVLVRLRIFACGAPRLHLIIGGFLGFGANMVCINIDWADTLSELL